MSYAMCDLINTETSQGLRALDLYLYTNNNQRTIGPVPFTRVQKIC